MRSQRLYDSRSKSARSKYNTQRVVRHDSSLLGSNSLLAFNIRRLSHCIILARSQFLTLLTQPMELHSDRSGIQFLPNNWRLQVHRLGKTRHFACSVPASGLSWKSFSSSVSVSPREATKKVEGSKWSSTRVQFRDSELSRYLFVRQEQEQDRDICILISLKLDSVLAETHTEESNKIK